MATTKQTQIIVGRMVEFQDRFEKLPNNDAQWLIQNTGEAIELIITAVMNRAKTVASAPNIVLSDVISRTAILATTKKFVVKYKFTVDKSRTSIVKISHLDNYFKVWFMDKTEDYFYGSVLYGRKLNKSSVDGSILSELGGQKKAEITLREIFEMIKLQAHGETGDLLTNGDVNIFYVRDVNDVLRVALVSWTLDGWSIEGCSIGNPRAWIAGNQVFSHNPPA